MRTFFVWYLVCTFVLIGITFGIAKADTPPEGDCTYKPRQSDEVIVFCGTLKGTGSVSVKLCGINYTVDVVCK